MSFFLLFFIHLLFLFTENAQPVEIGGPPAIHSSLDYLEEPPIKDKYIR